MRTVFYPSKGSSLPLGLVSDLVEHELRKGPVEIIGHATARPIAAAGTTTLKRGPGRPRKQPVVPTGGTALPEKPKRGRRSSRKRRALSA